MTDKNGRVYPKWSEEDCTRLLALVDAGESWDAIAAAIDRTVWACKVKLSCLRGHKGLPGNQATRVAAPVQQRMAEVARLQRLHDAALPRSLTAEFCGDPLPGRSALDEKLRAAPQVRSRITLPGMEQRP